MNLALFTSFRSIMIERDKRYFDGRIISNNNKIIENMKLEPELIRFVIVLYQYQLNEEINFF